jgi:pyranose oxidase
MIDSGPQIRRRPGEHILNCFRYQIEPNLSVDEMLANRELYSIPGRSNDPSAANMLGKSFRPPLGRLNFENPEQNPNRNLEAAAVMYAVGGMFSMWSGFAPDPVPFERTEVIPSGEWEHILHVAHELMNVHVDAFEPSAVNRALMTLLGKAQHPIRNIQMGAEKRSTTSPLAHLVNWTGVDTMLGPLLDAAGRCAPNLTILEEHRGEELCVRGDRIDSVVVRNLKNWEAFEIRAENVVVAGGSFLTPRLLWQSGIRPAALGRYLHENPVATVQLQLNTDVIALLREDSQNPARAEEIPIAWNDPAPKSGFEPTVEKPWMAHFNREGRTMTYNFQCDVRTVLDLTWYGTTTPVPENRITFSEKYSDRFGQPQITIDFGMTTEDAKGIVDMLADMSEVASLLGTPIPASQPPFIAGPQIVPPGTAVHLMGAYRMGLDPETSVVDADCKVWGFQNLYLGGQGVIDKKIASNPTLAACAIAVKSACKMLGRPIEELVSVIDAQHT